MSREEKDARVDLERKLRQFTDAALMAFESGSSVVFSEDILGKINCVFSIKENSFSYTYHEDRGVKYVPREKPVMR